MVELDLHRTSLSEVCSHVEEGSSPGPMPSRDEQAMCSVRGLPKCSGEEEDLVICLFLSVSTGVLYGKEASAKRHGTANLQKRLLVIGPELIR